MEKKEITYVPGLYKIYDEIIVNAIDQTTRLKMELNAGHIDIKPVKTIRISIDKNSGYIEITNDGRWY